MHKKLDVYLNNILTGSLTQNKDGQMRFSYHPAWLERTDAVPLSCSLPLRRAPFSQKECRGFFAGILPEQSNREVIAKILGISARNDYAMLEQIGGECAGAVTFMPSGVSLPDGLPTYHPLGEHELAQILRDLPNRPLLVGEPGLRLSLAGAQNKIAVHVAADGAISLPVGGAPSTHILKPASLRFVNLVSNEAFCMTLAQRIGIPTASVTIGTAKDMEYLLIKRYDRYRVSYEHVGIQPHSSTVSSTKRLHQEDFCQALGTPPEKKYQSEGGPGFQDCFDLLRNTSSFPAINLQHLLDIVLFNVIIGNHDAHGKNFSLLYDFPDSGSSVVKKHKIKFAPAYDLLSTVLYPELTPKMAMRIGGEYESAKLRRTDIEVFAQQTRLSVAAVCKRGSEVAARVKNALSEIQELYPAMNALVPLIKDRADGVQQMLR